MDALVRGMAEHEPSAVATWAEAADVLEAMVRDEDCFTSC